MTQFICGGEKYYLGGTKGDSICLDVLLKDFPQHIEIEGQKLLRKSEFHVTFLSAYKIAERQGIADPDFLDKLVADFCAYTAEHPVEFAGFTGEFRLAAQNDRKTVIAMCDVSNFKEFVELTNAKYDISIEYPPTHVTLYSLDPNIGIFLNDAVDLQNLTTIIPAPIQL